MKFLKTLLFLFILLLFSVRPPLTAAQETQVAPVNTGLMPEKIMPPIPSDTPPILGQEHAYSVLLRGNGDAVVTMRAAFTDDTPIPTNTLSLRVPRVEPRRLTAFQIIREPQCIRYKPSNPGDSTGQPVCMEYQEPNYFQWYGQTKYQKATTQFTGDTLTVTLPEPVKPTKSGSILIIYSAAGYAKKNLFGAYNYAFETFKVENTYVTKSTIGISVDSDLVLAGAKGAVNYRFNDTNTMSLAAEAEKSAIVSPQLDQMYSQAGYGTITKNVSHLEPLESYTVRGRYADSLIRLYGKGILIGLIIFIAATVVFFFLGRAAIRALTVPPVRGTLSPTVDIAMTIGGSFVAAGIIAVYTAALFMLRNTAQQVIGYEMIGMVSLLATIISIGVYGFLLIAPAILVGIRRGLAWGLGAFGLTIFFLLVNAVVMIVVLMFLYGSGNRQMPIYNMMRGINPQQESSTMMKSSE